jgi:tungstate transport system permease protein
MDFLLHSLAAAADLIARRDPEVTAAVVTSLSVSAWSILLASLLAVPAGVALGVARFRGRQGLMALLNTLMAVPTVVIGLFVYSLISRQGPLGSLGILFTPTAMVMGQALLALPIVTNYTLAAVQGADSRIIPTALTLGASPLRAAGQLLREIRSGILAAVIAGFGRVLSEVGIAMILGGNIRGLTRTMTTAIAMETGKGEFAVALALGLVLMTVALIINLVLTKIQQR